MKPIIQNQVIYKILKSKQDNAILPSSQKCISLNTAGTHSTVLLNPSSNTPYINIQSKTLDEIRSQAGLTENQMKIVTWGIRFAYGKKSVPPYYQKHVSDQSQILDIFYIHETHNFITATESGKPTEYNDIWAVYAPIVPLIECVNVHRENLNPSDFMIKIMCDSRQGKTKVFICIIPLNDTNVEKKHGIHMQKVEY